MIFSLSPFAPENLVSRDGFDSPVPRQPAHLHTQAESVLTYGTPPEFRCDVHMFIKPPYAIASVSSLSGHALRTTDGVHCRESAGTGPVVSKSSQLYWTIVSGRRWRLLLETRQPTMEAWAVQLPPLGRRTYMSPLPRPIAKIFAFSPDHSYISVQINSNRCSARTFGNNTII